MLNLDNAIVYDIETFPNAFTLHMEMLNSDANSTWQISHFRDDRYHLMTWFNYLRNNRIPMIGFNTLHFDYKVIHYIMNNPNATVEQIYAFAMNIINSQDRFGGMIWESDRFAPQIDLFKIHHFDNKAKTTSLKALAINMHSENVMDMPVEIGSNLTQYQIDNVLIPYGRNDVKETKQFAHFSMQAMNFRIGMMETIAGDVLNMNDSKLGSKLLEQRLGEDVCYDRSSGRKQPRQTVRYRIALKDIIFPYIRFNNPEFQRVLNWMMEQTLTPEDLDDPDAQIKTKGVFTHLKANVGGIEFGFGTGGIHGSVISQKFIADQFWKIEDIDVRALYPSIAIVNKLFPAHLGEAFIAEYAKLPIERQAWQERKGKKCVEANSIKLASNGTYGNSNNKYSVFYDPLFTMTITINGQLLLCMLAEWLIDHVPTIQLIQINTDGITYRIHESMRWKAEQVYKQWEKYTLLELEKAEYSRMWIRDVNNYVAEDLDGKLKQKGAYWHPGEGDDYAKSISEAQPPAWHKDLGGTVSIKAAVAYMKSGVDPETFIRNHRDKFDFMLRAKVDRASKLMLGGRELQRTSRYYVSCSGASLVKISPPAAGNNIGDYKRKAKITDKEFNTILASIPPGAHDERIHTKNKGRYEIREMSIEAGWKVAECNDAANFNFENIDYRYYVNEARKLII